MSNIETSGDQTMNEYLDALITEKGSSTDASIDIDGVVGLTWQHLIDFIDQLPEHHEDIRKNLVHIDFVNGDVFDYLTHLAKGMIEACGLGSYLS